MAPKRWAGLALVTVATLALAIRYTPLLDPDLKATPQMNALAARFHTGAGPCLRYQDPAPPDVTQTAAALHAAGLTSDDLGGLVGDLFERAKAQELAQHTLSEEDEWIQVISDASSSPRRLAINLKRDRLRDVLRQIFSVEVPKRKLLTELAPPARQALDAAWARNAREFLPSGLIPLLRDLRQRETTQRLDAIARLLAEHAKAGTVPARLDELGLPQGELVDGWGREIEFERQESKWVITAIGDDAAAPTTREIAWAAGAPTVAPECPAPKETTVAKKALTAALDDVGALAGSARVVPSLKDGRVTGFKLFAIRPGSILAQAGLCNGDVVKAINGRPMASPEEALELYALVRAASLLEVTLDRGGAEALLRIRLE